MGYASFSHIFKGKVENGKPKIDNPELWASYLRQLEGKEFDLTIEQHKERRTQAANRYYWGVVCEIAGQHFGYTKDEMHEAFKILFLRKPKEEGKPATVGSTATLDTIQFTDYLDKCIRFCAEHGIEIPEAGEIKINIQ